MNPQSPLVDGLLSLFQGELRGVAFPGADAPALLAAAEALADAETAVEQAQAALDIARAARNGAETALQAQAQRTLAYARVYAEDRPELAAKLEVLAPRPGRKPRPESVVEGAPPRRRGRPPKSSATAPLFSPQAPEALGADDAAG